MLNLSEFKFYWDLQRDERGEGERKEGRGKREEEGRKRRDRESRGKRERENREDNKSMKLVRELYIYIERHTHRQKDL